MKKRRQYPQLVNAYELANEKSLMRSCQAGIMWKDKQIWVPARALGWCSWVSALRLAWGVFQGRYDALVWPGQKNEE